MPDEQDPERQKIVELLIREKDEQRRKLLEKALNDPANRGKWLEMYQHAGRHGE